MANHDDFILSILRYPVHHPRNNSKNFRIVPSSIIDLSENGVAEIVEKLNEISLEFNKSPFKPLLEELNPTE